MTEVLNIQDETHFDGIIKEGGSHVFVVHFSANWAPQCQQMNDVLKELAKDTQFIHCKFLTLEAEDVPVISERYNISAVPTFIFIKMSHEKHYRHQLKNQKEVDRLDGANAGELTKKLKVLALASAVTTSEPAPQPKEDLNTRLKKLIEAAPVMLFIKGTPAEPRCGFSRQMVQILNERNVKFSSFDILQDEEVRQGLKTYSNWPTFPQLYVNGELLGGVDIVKEMAESGELDSNLPKQATLEDRLRVLINKAPVMLFIKGSSEQPKCGFSKQIVQILAETNVEYQTFDILADEEVRQGLKTFSNWPTYPQLYVKGELIGGLDIVKELKESGELEKVLKEGQS